MYKNPWDDDPLVEQQPRRIQGPPREPPPQTPDQARKDAIDVQRGGVGLERDRIGIERDRQQLERDRIEFEKAQREAQQGVKPTEDQGKSAGWLGRAFGANQDYESLGLAAPGPVQDYLRFNHPFIANTIAPEGYGGSTPDWQRATATQSEFINAMLRRDTGATINDKEAMDAYKQYFPQPGETDPDVLKQHAAARRRAIEGLLNTAGPAAEKDGLLDRVNKWRAGQNEAADTTQRQVIAQPDELQASDGTTKHQEDPMRRAINTRLGSMMSAGTSDDKIRAYAARVGVKPSSLDAALKFRRTPDFARWKRANPGTAYPISDPGLNVPITGTERAIAQAARSPGGAYAMRAGNSVVAGQMPNIASVMGNNKDRARLALDMASQDHPYASLAGNITGTALNYGAMSAGLTKLAATPAGKLIPKWIGEKPAQFSAVTPRALVGDAAYGASYGQGMNDDPLSGAVASVAGGMAGRGIPRMVGSAVSPTGGAAADLYGMGVRPSVGQRAGGFVNNVEQRLQDVPVVGDMIRGTRQRARDQFERGVFDDALKEIGDQLPKEVNLGQRAHAYMQKSFDKAYDKARSGMAFVADPEFTAGATQLIDNAKAGALSPEAAKRLDSVYKNMILRRAKGGVAGGDAYKLTASQIGKMGANASDPEFKASVRELGSLFDDAARRHSPPEAVAALDAADAGYAKAVRIEDAARRRGGGTGRFSPTQYDSAVQSMSSGVRDRDYLAGTALNSNIADAGKRLVDTIPDSGTAQRVATGVAATGGGYLSPPVALGLGAIGLANAPGVRNITTGLMAPTSKASLRLFGNRARGAARGGGIAGTSYLDWLNEQRQR